MFPIDISPSAFPSVPFSEWDWSFIQPLMILVIGVSVLATWAYIRRSALIAEERKANNTTALAAFIALSIAIGGMSTLPAYLSARHEAQSGYIEQALEDQYGLNITSHTADSIVAYIDHDRTVGAFSVPIMVTDNQGQTQKIDAVIDYETQTLGLFNGPTELPHANRTDKLISSLPECRTLWDIRLKTSPDHKTTAAVTVPDTTSPQTYSGCLYTIMTVQSNNEKVEWDTENLPKNVRIETTQDPITPTTHTLHLIVDGEIEPGTEFTITQK